MTYLFRDDDDLIERVFAKGIPTFAGHDHNIVRQQREGYPRGASVEMIYYLELIYLSSIIYLSMQSY